MKPAYDPNAQAPPAPRSLRAESDLDGDTAQPPLTSGFGAVLDHERELQESTDSYLRTDDRAQPTARQYALRDQSAQLGGNIALLKQRYEALPHPERFRTFHGRIAPAVPGVATARIDPLRRLIVQHRNLLADITTLRGHRADGQRGELILAEVARSHEEMAGTLAAFAFPDPAVHDSLPVPALAGSRTDQANERP